MVRVNGQSRRAPTGTREPEAAQRDKDTRNQTHLVMDGRKVHVTNKQGHLTRLITVLS